MAIITSPVSGETITATTAGQVYDLLYRDLVRLVDGAAIETKYPELDRNYGEWGAIIEELRVRAQSSVAVNPNTTALCAPHYPELDSVMFDEWTEKEYYTNIRRVDLTKVVRGEQEYADLLASIINSNVEGYTNETNQGIERAMVSVANNPSTVNKRSLVSVKSPTMANQTTTDLYGRIYTEFLDNSEQLRASGVGVTVSTNAGVAALSTIDGSSPPTYNQIMSEVLFRAFDMTRTNARYTTTGGEYGARREDLVIYVSDKFAAGLDMKYLQALYNQDGLNQLPEIRTYATPEPFGLSVSSGGTTPTYTSADVGVILIMEKRVLNHVARYMEATTAEVDCQKSIKYGLHIEDMIKYVPFYKLWAVFYRSPSLE